MVTDFNDFFPEPREWTTANDPMTHRQAEYLQELARELGFEFEPRLTKADASRQISISHRLNTMPAADRKTAKDRAVTTQTWERLKTLTPALKAYSLGKRVSQSIPRSVGRNRLYRH
jgi:hypothetical protein